MMSRLLLATAAILSLAAISPASADIMWSTGNQQFTNVNIGADVNATSVTGAIGNTGYTMTFKNMISPYAPAGDGTSPITMHCQHGVAFCESYADSLTSTSQHTGFSSLTLQAEAGTAWTAGDFALDLLGRADATVTFEAYDGNTLLNVLTSTTRTLATCPIDATGQNPYNYVTFSVTPQPGCRALPLPNTLRMA